MLILTLIISTMIGIFDSGFGGLTCLKQIRQVMPQYNYIFLGDNARAPYGTHSFPVVYQYTLQAVNYLFKYCNLVILACNTASAKALRTIQQNFIPATSTKRLLGVIRPTAEIIPQLTNNKHIGIFATPATCESNSYPIEIHKIDPNIHIAQQPCPLFVPIIENSEHLNQGADYFIKKYTQQLLKQDPLIDTILLACTHYPLLINKLQQFIPPNINIVTQDSIVANSLKNYLEKHTQLEQTLSKNHNTGQCTYLTTETPENFTKGAEIFLKEKIKPIHIELNQT